jgi:hypothetical protein
MPLYLAGLGFRKRLRNQATCSAEATKAWIADGSHFVDLKLSRFDILTL